MDDAAVQSDADTSASTLNADSIDLNLTVVGYGGCIHSDVSKVTVREELK